MIACKFEIVKLLKLKQIFWLVSPTRALVDFFKWNRPINKHESNHKGDVLRFFSCLYFCIDFALIVLFSILFNRFFFETVHFQMLCTLNSLLLYFSTSRICEIMYAFSRDAWDSLKVKPRKNSNLRATERIKFLIRSYFGLITNFSIIYYFLPLKALFETELLNFHDAVLYSAASIAAFNFEKLSAIHAVSRAITMLEVFSGIFLLTFAIAVYFAELSKRSK